MRTKTCTKCKIEKEFHSFHLVSSKRIDYRRSTCISCEGINKQKISYKENQKLYARNRRRNKEQRERENIQAKLYGQTIRGRARRLFLAAQYRARKLNLEFSLTLVRIEFGLIIGSCERTGIPFDLSSPIKSQFNPWSPSIDKKNPYGGYTDENTQIVCNVYNLGKGQMSDDEFLQFCRIVVKYHDK